MIFQGGQRPVCGINATKAGPVELPYPGDCKELRECRGGHALGLGPSRNLPVMLGAKQAPDRLSRAG